MPKETEVRKCVFPKYVSFPSYLATPTPFLVTIGKCKNQNAVTHVDLRSIIILQLFYNDLAFLHYPCIIVFKDFVIVFIVSSYEVPKLGFCETV